MCVCVCINCMSAHIKCRMFVQFTRNERYQIKVHTQIHEHKREFALIILCAGPKISVYKRTITRDNHRRHVEEEKKIIRVTMKPTAH